MKNYLMFALLIGATASMTFGQFGVVVDPAKTNVVCPDEECHVAPVFMGEGGFVGEMSGVSDMVTFVVECGNTITEGTASADSTGVVRQLFSMANGLACHSEGGSIQIHGLADGGWYWITDDMNSAVSPLIAKDALMGDEVMPTDPGGVTLMASDYGTYVKSGDRVGILPHFVPTAPAPEMPPPEEPEAATVCMPYWTGRAWAANDTDCMLGDGGTTIVVTGSNSIGQQLRVTDGMVYRPVKGAPGVTVTLGLWGNGSGHVNRGDNVFLGWDVLPGQGRTPAPLAADFTVDLPNEPNGTSPGSAGISAVKNGPVVASTTPMTADPGTDADSTATGVQHDGDGTDGSDSTDGIDNGFGFVGTEKKYCKQATSRDSDDNLLFHFVTAGGTFMVNPNAPATSGTPAVDNKAGNPSAGVATPTGLAAANSWMAQAEWVEEWNRVADADRAIKRTTAMTGGTTYRVPQVVCAMKAGAKVERKATGSITIEPSDAYCGSGKNHSVDVRVYAPLATANRLNPNTIPAIAEGGKVGTEKIAASTMLTVMCP